jgi:hypothetical protein
MGLARTRSLFMFQISLGNILPVARRAARPARGRALAPGRVQAIKSRLQL